MPLADYQDLDLYNSGRELTGNDFVVGWNTELWIKQLATGASLPTERTVTLDADAAVDDTSISCTADVEFKVYRGDILKFINADTIVVVDADTTIAATSTTVPVLPVLAALDGTTTPDTAKSYGMVPVLSNRDGGGFEGSGTSAEARNKSQGLWPARQIVERDGTIAVSGSFFRNDPGASVLERLGRTSANVLAQVRYFPFLSFTDEAGVTKTEGTGPGAVQGVFTVNRFNINPANRSEFVTADGELALSGRVRPYAVLV